MGFTATPDFTGPILSGRQINALSSWQNYLHAQGKLSRFPQPIYAGDNTVADTLGYNEIFRGYVNHSHRSGYTEYLEYDLEIEKDQWDGGNVYVRVFYKTITPETPANAIIELSRSDFGSERVRGRVALADFPTAETHPEDKEQVEVAVFAYRTDDAYKVRCHGTVYTLAEIVYPDDYTALNDATALTDGEDVDVPDDLTLLADNCEALDYLSQGYVDGFRSEESGEVYGGQSRTLGPWRWFTNMNGRMYYRVAMWKVAGGTSEAIRVRFYVNTSYLLKTLTLLAGHLPEEPHIEEGYFDLTGFTPTPSQQIGIRIHAVVDSPNDAQGGARIDYLFEDGAEMGSYADFGRAEHLAEVKGDTGTNQLRTLWDNQKIIAGDDGTGYGQDGFDVAGGLPFGHAVLARRSLVTHRSAQRGVGRQRIVHVDGVAYQVIYLRRLLDKDYLFYRSKGAELVHIAGDGQENSQGLDDYDDENPYQVLNLSEIPSLTYGQMFCLRARMDIEENEIDFAKVGWL